MTEGQVRTMLATACKLYARRFDERAVKPWHRMLGDLSDVAAASALREHAATSEWFPTVADLRRIALRDDGVDVAGWWAEVREAISSHGRNREPAWSCASVAAAVRALGWRDLCNANMDDMPTIRAQFERYARGHHEREERRRNVGALAAPGASELVAAVVGKLTPGGGR